MKTTYKIIHPSHVRDWAAIHAVGKTVRWIDPGQYGRGVVPPMDDANFGAGCVMLAVEEGNERRAWKAAGFDTHAQGGSAVPGRHKFHDYNF